MNDNTEFFLPGQEAEGPYTASRIEAYSKELGCTKTEFLCRLMLARRQAAGMHTLSVKELEDSNPDIPFDLLKQWTIREHGMKYVPYLLKAGVLSEKSEEAEAHVNEPEGPFTAERIAVYSKELGCTKTEFLCRLMLSRQRADGIHFVSIQELEDGNPDVPFDLLKQWTILEHGMMCVPYLLRAGVLSVKNEETKTHTNEPHELQVEVGGSEGLGNDETVLLPTDGSAEPVADLLAEEWDYVGTEPVLSAKVEETKAHAGKPEELQVESGKTEEPEYDETVLLSPGGFAEPVTALPGEGCNPDGADPIFPEEPEKDVSSETDERDTDISMETDGSMLQTEVDDTAEAEALPIPVGKEPQNIRKRLENLFGKLDLAYPDKEIFRLNKDHREWGKTATDLYRKLGYSDRGSFLKAYGYTIKEMVLKGRPRPDSADERDTDIPVETDGRTPQIEMDDTVGADAIPVPVGKEPQNIRKRLENLFGKLDLAYPDKEIFRLDTDHKEWGKTATGLYRKLGYSDRRSFLEAYGYTFKEGLFKGRPRVNENSVPTEWFFDELKARYPNGSSFITAKELLRANPDLQSGYDSLRKKAQERFGMPLYEYLIKEGILCSPETSFRQLKNRYPQPFGGEINELQAANEDLNWKMIADHSRESGFASLEECLFRNEILADSPAEAAVKAAQRELGEMIRDVGRILEGKEEKPSTIAELRKRCPDVSKSRIRKLLEAIGSGDDPETYLKKMNILDDSGERRKKGLPVFRDTEEGRQLIFSGKTGCVAVIPDGVSIICGNAFDSNAEVETVILPASVREVRKNAFSHCDALKAVYLEGSNTGIGADSFYSCRELRFVGDRKTLRLNGAFEEYFRMLSEAESIVDGMKEMYEYTCLDYNGKAADCAARTELERLLARMMSGSDNSSPSILRLFELIRNEDHLFTEVVKEVSGDELAAGSLPIMEGLADEEEIVLEDYLHQVRRLTELASRCSADPLTEEKGNELYDEVENLIFG